MYMIVHCVGLHHPTKQISLTGVDQNFVEGPLRIV